MATHDHTWLPNGVMGGDGSPRLPVFAIQSCECGEARALVVEIPTMRDLNEQRLRRTNALLGEWVVAGASMKTANVLSRSGITPERAAEMTDYDLLNLRGFGRVALTETRALIGESPGGD